MDHMSFMASTSARLTIFPMPMEDISGWSRRSDFSKSITVIAPRRRYPRRLRIQYAWVSVTCCRKMHMAPMNAHR